MMKITLAALDSFLFRKMLSCKNTHNIHNLLYRINMLLRLQFSRRRYSFDHLFLFHLRSHKTAAAAATRHLSKAPAVNVMVLKAEETSRVPLSEATHYLWSDSSARLPASLGLFLPSLRPSSFFSGFRRWR